MRMKNVLAEAQHVPQDWFGGTDLYYAPEAKKYFRRRYNEKLNNRATLCRSDMLRDAMGAATKKR